MEGIQLFQFRIEINIYIFHAMYIFIIFIFNWPFDKNRQHSLISPYDQMELKQNAFLRNRKLLPAIFILTKD